MGQTLSEPVTELHSRSGRNGRQIYAISDMQGWRVSMEDANACILEFEEDKETSFYGVYDGHGGAGMARYAGLYCHKRVVNDPEFAKGNYSAALKNAFLAMDEDVKKDPNFMNETSGCTAVTLLITKDNRLFCANAGDSRCVLSSAGQAIPLSYDHKPNNEHEIARINAAGGFVQYGRVNANLALSRAFGDFEFKRNTSLPPEQQIVTANPDIIEEKIVPEHEFVVLACDGIWDVMSNQQVVDMVRSKIAKGMELDKICEHVVQKCLAPDPSSAVGCDNMTILIVGLLMGSTEEAWREKCKKVAIVDGLEVDPLKEDEPEPEPEANHLADAEEEHHGADDKYEF